MKYAFKYIFLVLMIVTSGWVGYQIRNRPMHYGSITLSPHGGVDPFPVEAYREVNGAIDAQITEIFGNLDDSTYFVSVVPVSSGYSVKFAADSGAIIWDDKLQGQLTDWIFKRMLEIQLEANSAAQEAETPNRR